MMLSHSIIVARILNLSASNQQMVHVVGDYPCETGEYWKRNLQVYPIEKLLLYKGIFCPTSISDTGLAWFQDTVSQSLQRQALFVQHQEVQFRVDAKGLGWLQGMVVSQYCRGGHFFPQHQEVQFMVMPRA